MIAAARWNGQAPQITTGAANVSEAHCQLVNCHAGTIAIAITGTVSTTAPMSLCRNDSSSLSAGSATSSEVAGDRGAGRLAS